MQTSRRLMAVLGMMALVMVPIAGAQGAQSPEEVARAFMEAGNAGDLEKVRSLVTEKAWEGARTNLDVGDAENVGFEVGEAEIEGDSAMVPVQVNDGGQEMTMRLKMRREKSEWRIHAMTMVLAEGMEVTMDLENPGGPMGAASEAMMESMESLFEDLGQEMEDAFAGIAEDLQNGFTGGSEEEIGRQQREYEVLAATSVEAFEAGWMSDLHVKDKPAREALEALVTGLGWTLNENGNDEALSEPVTVDLKDVPRLEAIELVCRQVGLYPEYPAAGDSKLEMSGGLIGAMGEALADALVAMADDPEAAKVAMRKEMEAQEARDNVERAKQRALRNAVTMKKGPRPSPVTFSGPFRLTMLEVHENVPYATGQIALNVCAVGLSPSVLNLRFTIDEVRDAEGNGLAVNESSYWENDDSGEAPYTLSASVRLKNLLRNVTAIESIRGKQTLILPTEVEEIRFDSPQEGDSQTVGDFKVTLEQAGTSSEFVIEGPRERLETLIVKYLPKDAQGNSMPREWDSQNVWGDRMDIGFSTDEPPATIMMKVVTQVEELEYPFEFKGIPLQHYAEMPEELEELQFAGHDAPVSVEFFGMKPNEHFPGKAPDKAAIRLENHSNKDILNIHTTFRYIDEAGKKLNEFPEANMFSGPYGQNGQQPCVRAGETEETEKWVPFMPAGTKEIRFVVERVEFIDSSSWRSETGR